MEPNVYMLAGVHLPPIYETAFAHANPSDGKVTLQALNRVLFLGGTNPYMIDKVSPDIETLKLPLKFEADRCCLQIIGLVVPRDASYVTKSEFNAAIALLALSQKNVGNVYYVQESSLKFFSLYLPLNS